MGTRPRGERNDEARCVGTVVPPETNASAGRNRVQAAFAMDTNAARRGTVSPAAAADHRHDPVFVSAAYGVAMIGISRADSSRNCCIFR